jgi:hypothetical protein
MPDSPISINVDLNRLVDQAVEFANSLKKHLGSVVSMPALARQQLDEVLAEIDRTFTAVDSVVQEHLKVALDPSLIETGPDLMLQLSGPELPLRIEVDRGHCTVISEIYDNHLKGLLDPLFRDKEARAAVHQNFVDLAKGDQDLFSLFVNVGTMLQGRAQQVLRLQLNHDVAGAKALLKKDAASLIDLRQRLQDAHLALVVIKNDFIKGMVPPP